MSGTKEGGIKTRDTNLKKHGKDFYKEIGRKGGQKTGKKGFALNPALAVVAGRKGGKNRWRKSSQKSSCLE